MLTSAIIVFVCLMLGGVLKGATGAGAPILAVPAIAMLFDVQFAVAVMLVPNLATNLWQAWRFRKHLPPGLFAYAFAGAGALGTTLGTVGLAKFPHEVLAMVVALAVFAYIGFRVARADWTMPFSTGRKLSFPMGLMAGTLQGMSGISAPISLSFLNALRLDRPVFIATVSVYFTVMTIPQVPALAWFGILTTERMVISALAIIPIFVGMPLGAQLAKHFSRDTFDRLILWLLGALALKLLFDAVV